VLEVGGTAAEAREDVSSRLNKINIRNPVLVSNAVLRIRDINLGSRIRIRIRNPGFKKTTLSLCVLTAYKETVPTSLIKIAFVFL
jgi:hypothetical protein